MAPSVGFPPAEVYFIIVSAERIQLLYDGACPICRREAAWLRRADRRGRLQLVDISASDFDPARFGLSRNAVEGALHAVGPNGQIVRGMDAVRAAYRAVGWGWLAAPTGWPILRPVFDRLYRAFARNRLRIGRWLGRETA